MDDVKVGARNSRADAERLQQIHDYAVDNGAQCPRPEAESDFGVEVMSVGDSVKALGGGKVSGYLVRFDTVDLENDYFAKDTDFGEVKKLPLLYHHGFDAALKRRRIGTAEITPDDAGLWLEGQLDLRDEYEKRIYELAEMGKLGLSSGAAAHVVERQEDGSRNKITQWYIAEASLTPTPAEYRNVVSIKSLQVITSLADDNAQSGTTAESGLRDKQGDDSATPQPKQESQKMEMTEEIKALVKEAVDGAVKAYAVATEETTKAASLTVTQDEADRPFKNIADNFNAIKAFETSKGRQEHPRLKALKAITGGGEAVPSDGGFLLDPELSAEFLKPVHADGPFASKARKLSTAKLYGWINGVNETSRVNGSRWGGVLGYRVAEGDSITASKPAFRRINWELKKYVAAVYSTDELLADAPLFNSIAAQAVREEIGFMLEDDIVNGTGVGGPLGLLQSPARIDVTRLDANLIQHADILKMWQRLSPPLRGGAAWFINSEAEPQLDALTFTSGTTGILSPYVSYSPDGVMKIKGRPVYVSEHCAALGTKGDIFLANMGEYYLFEHSAGQQLASSIHVAFLTDQSVFRVTYRVDGLSSWASALTPYKGTNTQSPFIALDAAS
jgi:HK97 family phage major capsid protein